MASWQCLRDEAFIFWTPIRRPSHVFPGQTPTRSGAMMLPRLTRTERWLVVWCALKKGHDLLYAFQLRDGSHLQLWQGPGVSSAAWSRALCLGWCRQVRVVEKPVACTVLHIGKDCCIKAWEIDGEELSLHGSCPEAHRDFVVALQFHSSSRQSARARPNLAF